MCGMKGVGELFSVTSSLPGVEETSSGFANLWSMLSEELLPISTTVLVEESVSVDARDEVFSFIGFAISEKELKGVETALGATGVSDKALLCFDLGANVCDVYKSDGKLLYTVDRGLMI